VQGLDKGNRSVGKSKVRFRKAPKSDNVYIKLLVKVPFYIFSHAALPGRADLAPIVHLPPNIVAVPHGICSVLDGICRGGSD
jgi:hypothetical protein